MSDAGKLVPTAPSAIEHGANSSVAFWLAVLALFAAYVVSALYFVHYGRINQDEGWYLYAARLVFQGRVPYRDFAFFQAPFLPYFYGSFQQLFGGSLEVGRLTSFVLGTLTVASGAALSSIWGGRFGTLLFLALAPVTPLLTWAFTTTRTEPLNACLLMVSAFCLFRRHSGPVSASIAAVTAVLTLATRVASLSIALLVLCWVGWQHRHSRRELSIVLLPALLAVVLFAATLNAAGPDVALFNLVTSQAERHDQLHLDTAWSLEEYITMRVIALSTLRSFYGGVPLLAFCCAFGVFGALVTARKGESFVQQASALATFSFAAYLPNMAPRIVFPVYFAASFPLFLVLLAWCIGYVYSHAPREVRNAVSAGTLMLLFFHLAATVAHIHDHISDEPSDLDELREAAGYIAAIVPPDKTLATMDTYLAVESGRSVPSGWEMGIFSYFPNRSREEGERLKLLTEERLEESLRNPSVGAVALSDRSLGVLASRTAFGYRANELLNIDDLHRALPALKRFRLDRVIEDFGQFDDRLYVLLPVQRP